MNSASASLADIRFLFTLLVGYAGVFHIGEVLSIRVRDVSTFGDFMRVYLIKRKNDQYKDGHVLVIARSWKPTCPVGVTERILSLLPDSSGSSYPIIRRIVNSRHSKERFHDSLGISYSTAYASFKSYISPFVSDASLYGTHSIRIGGANDAGFRSLDSSMKDRHVGWTNPRSKFRYLEAVPEELIEITRSMNIYFVIRGPVGGPGSRSLLWFLTRFPAPILVRFFLASSVRCGGYLLGLPCILLEFTHFLFFLVYVFASLHYFLLHELGYPTPGKCYICLCLSL